MNASRSPSKSFHSSRLHRFAATLHYPPAYSRACRISLGKTCYYNTLLTLFSCLLPCLEPRALLPSLMPTMSTSHHVEDPQEPTPLGHLLLGPSASARYRKNHNNTLLAQLNHCLTVLQTDEDATGTPEQHGDQIDTEGMQDLGTILGLRYR